MPVNRKELLIADLKHIRDAFIKVYPLTFRQIVAYWQITLAAIFAIGCAFYLDPAVRDIIRAIDNTVIDYMFAFGRIYGSWRVPVFLFAALYLAGLILKKYKIRETGLLIGECYVFAGIVTLIFKSALGRWRPYTNRGDLAFGGWSWTNDPQFSYYSGHAATAFAISTVLASMTKNIYLKAFYYFLAIITCISRIYHDQHWFSDVLTGGIMAFLISRVLIAIHEEPVSDVSP